MNKVVSSLNLPVVSGLLQKHVEHGAILYKIVDESLWMTNDVASELGESIRYMIDIGCRPFQAHLVIVLAEGGRGRTYDELRYWQASGGTGVTLYDHELDDYLKAESNRIEGK